MQRTSDQYSAGEWRDGPAYVQFTEEMTFREIALKGRHHYTYEIKCVCVFV